MDDITNRDWLTKEEAEAFIGKNSDYYLDKWKAHSETSLKGWNWAAFFFGINWMNYRKMYIEALLYYIITAIAAAVIYTMLVLLGIWIDSNITQTLLTVIFTGVFGNKLHRNKALRVLRKSLSSSESERMSALEAKGGVSVAGAIIGVLLRIAISVSLAFLIYRYRY